MEIQSRWKQRFQNFERAINLLKEVQKLDINSLSDLEKEGVIQRFEYTLELAWKTLKDKLEYDGFLLERISPKTTLKEAYKNKYIDEIEKWLQMTDDRNLLSHTYDFEVFDRVLPIIINSYIPLITDLYNFLAQEQL